MTIIFVVLTKFTVVQSYIKLFRCILTGYSQIASSAVVLAVDQNPTLHNEILIPARCERRIT